MSFVMKGSPGRPLQWSFAGHCAKSNSPQQSAMLAHDTGVLSASTAFGKTVVAAWLIAQRHVNTLVLVHRRQLLEQWSRATCAHFSICRRTRSAHIGGGRKKPNGMIDVALIQSLVRKGVVDDRVAEYGHLIVDECHHLPAHSFEQVARRAKAKFVTGLSATVTRKDGHHPIIFMQCGPVRHRVDAKEQAAARPFEHTVLVRSTAFRPVRDAHADVRVQFHDLCDELIADEARNRLICDDVIQSVREGRSPIVLTERNEHLDRLAACSRACSPPPGCVARRNGQEGAQGDHRPTGEDPCLMKSEYCWRPADMSVRDLMMRGWIRCF